MTATPEISPTEIIGKGDWRQALFLTYSLSLSFFETRLLRHGGQRITGRDWHVVADLDGYQVSLGERLSNRVGVEYRLTPVAMERGVFHPKIAYLAGDTNDVLILGSGNLTFGGHGRNVECAEVIKASEHPRVFRELAAFFTAVDGRKDLMCPDRAWVAKFGHYAARAGDRVDGGQTDVRLFHSVEEPVGDQLALLASELGPVRSLRVLSPFFDPDAAGILEFAEFIEAEELIIGLLPEQEHRSGFPFGAMPRSRTKVRTALVDAEHPNRRLHAKWFELVLKDGRRVVMTGSVNATRKSLLTTDNIEAAIVRIEPEGTASALGWKKCATPTAYQRMEFQAAGLGHRVVLQARLEPDYTLTGQLLAQSPVSGNWEAHLHLRDGSQLYLQVDVFADGTFRHSHGTESLAIQDVRGARLEMCRGGLRAECWVMTEMLLAAVQRGLPACVFTMVSGEHSIQDEVDLLNYLMQSAQQHVAVLALPRTGGASESADRTTDTEIDTDQPIPIESWTSDPEDEEQGNTVQSDRSSTSVARAVQTLLRTVRRRLFDGMIEAKANATKSGRPSSGQEVEDVEDGELTKEEMQSEFDETLAEFENFMEQTARELPEGPARAAALTVWFEVQLPLLVRRHPESEDGRNFAQRWMSLASGLAKSDQNRALRRHVVGTHLALSIGCPPIQFVRHREQLQMFFNGTLPENSEELLGLALEDPSFARALCPEVDQPLLATALAALRQIPTMREQYEQIDRALKLGRPVPVELPLLESPAGITMQDELSRGQSVRLKPMKRGVTHCPACFLSLPHTAKAEAQTYGFTRCTASHCQRYLVTL